MVIDTIFVALLAKPATFAICWHTNQCLRNGRNGRTPALPPTERIPSPTPDAFPQPADVSRKDGRQEQGSKVAGFETKARKQGNQGAREASSRWRQFRLRCVSSLATTVSNAGDDISPSNASAGRDGGTSPPQLPLLQGLGGFWGGRAFGHGAGRALFPVLCLCWVAAPLPAACGVPFVSRRAAWGRGAWSLPARFRVVARARELAADGTLTPEQRQTTLRAFVANLAEDGPDGGARGTAPGALASLVAAASAGEAAGGASPW